MMLANLLAWLHDAIGVFGLADQRAFTNSDVYGVINADGRAQFVDEILR